MIIFHYKYNSIKLYNINKWNKDKTKRKERKIHAVLTFKIEKKQSVCIDRDENAVNNMIKIVNHQIKYKERPLKYRRDCDLTKGSNPIELTLTKLKRQRKIKKGQLEQLVLK